MSKNDEAVETVVYKSEQVPNSFAKVSIGPPRCFCPDNKIIEQGSDGDRAMPSRERLPRLKVWQKAHQLTLKVYRITAAFPREELYGLTSQLRRACSSIAANLAEGCGRNGDMEFARFCSMAMGSASELEYHLLLAKDLKLIKPVDYQEARPTSHGVETDARCADAKS